MAQIISYRFEITPVSAGTTVARDTLKKGVAKSEGTIHEIVISPTSAQIQGIYGYLGLIRNGDDTSTVETAITALTP